MIKKFKNGNIVMNIKKDIKNGYYDGENIENFYHDECFMCDIYFTYIHGEPYFIDINTRLAYDSPFYYYTDFITHMYKKKKLKLYPHGKRISEEICNIYLDNED